MRQRRRHALATLLAAALVSVPAAARQSASPPVALSVLLERAADYFDQFTHDFSNVVAEERYLQQVSGRQQMMGLRGGPAIQGTAGASQRRELVSDYLLVKLAEGDRWVPFRDVFQVDGQPVRERQDRVAKLLLRPTGAAMDQAAEIFKESARYNIGEVERTINMPLLGLSFLDRDYQPRFRFTLGRQDGSVGADVWVINFQERTRPSLVQSPDGRDLFAGGRLWVDIRGRVAKTEIVIQDRGLRASITTSFRADERFHLNVPFEMIEDYALSNRNRITGRASYGRFRRFDVMTSTEAASTTPTTWVTDPLTGMVLVEIPSGQFAMGNTDSESTRRDELIHDVTLTAPFYLGRFEVTQQEWKTVMSSAPSRFASCGPRCPVENVSAEDVQKFIERLNSRSTPDIRYRLPTEAEWEYSCRAGTASAYSTGASITTQQANYGGRQPVPAGVFDANPWGLMDMHGNVAEWTGDGYAPYGEQPARDPKAPSGDRRVVRGGSWEASAPSTRCAARTAVERGARSGSVGFRIAADMINR